MSGNASFNMNDTALVSIAHVDAPEVVTSAQFDEILAETYERVGSQPGLLESLAGIRERRWWPEGYRLHRCCCSGRREGDCVQRGAGRRDRLTDRHIGLPGPLGTFLGRHGAQ